MSTKIPSNAPVTAEIPHQFQPKSDENEMCVCGHNIRSGVHIRPKLYTEEEVAEQERKARLDEHDKFCKFTKDGFNFYRCTHDRPCPRRAELESAGTERKANVQSIK